MKRSPPVKARKKLRSPDRGSSLLEECSMNDIVIQALTEYLIETPEPDAFWWPEHWFVEVSTSRWMADPRGSIGKTLTPRDVRSVSALTVISGPARILIGDNMILKPVLFYQMNGIILIIVNDARPSFICLGQTPFYSLLRSNPLSIP